MSKVLIIEDETEILSFLKPELIHEGYEVDTATDGREGLEKIENENFDIVLLDLMLPGLNGIEVCRRARKTTRVPIIMITARDQVIDKVTGLDNGADDYLTKPFSIEELLARMRVSLRRSTQAGMEKKEIYFKNLVLNENIYQVNVEEEIVELTKKEYLLLQYLMENKNCVVTREQILNKVWGYDYFGDTNVVDVYIRYLRSKLDDAFEEKYITTVRGIGYTMKETS